MDDLGHVLVISLGGKKDDGVVKNLMMMIVDILKTCYRVDLYGLGPQASCYPYGPVRLCDRVFC